MKRRLLISTVAVLALLGSLVGATAVVADPVPIQLSSQTYLWTDPVSGGQIHVTENVFEGDRDGPHHMRWQYVVNNISYDPNPPFSNGLSGFQIIFPQPLLPLELHGQTSPAIGGPWVQNNFSFQFPPFGVEWDAPLPGTGIMPGQTGIFGYSTFERARVVVESEGVGGGPAGWAHSWGLPEPIIDADGTTTGGPGLALANIQVRILSPLASWPTGGDVEGIDWFDNDWDGVSPRTWTPGDGIHVEGPAYALLGAIRNAIHDDPPVGLDPHVVGVLPAGGPVSVDLEFNLDFGGGSGVDPRLKFHDANSATNWDDGEDIVLDTNLDGLFGFNTQVNIFHGVQSVPGHLLPQRILGVASDPTGSIIKKVKYHDRGDADGRIEVGEHVGFLVFLVVRNNSTNTWTNVTVQDRFGAELDAHLAPIGFPTVGTATLTTTGNSAKEHLTWNIGTLVPGAFAVLTVGAHTDLNPAGHQEYTTAGTYEFNSGAVLKYLVDGKKNSAETGSILVTVVEPD